MGAGGSSGWRDRYTNTTNNNNMPVFKTLGRTIKDLIKLHTSVCNLHYLIKSSPDDLPR